MQKILLSFCLFFSNPLFAEDIFIHFTATAQYQIDDRVDRWWYGVLNSNAFNVTVSLVPLTDDQNPLESRPTPYCGFICANPHKAVRANCELALTPAFEGNTLHVNYKPDVLSPALVGYRPTVRLIFTSSTLQMEGVSLPPETHFELTPKVEITIDYADEKGFYILGESE